MKTRLELMAGPCTSRVEEGRTAIRHPLLPVGRLDRLKPSLRANRSLLASLQTAFIPFSGFFALDKWGCSNTPLLFQPETL